MSTYMQICFPTIIFPLSQKDTNTTKIISSYFELNILPHDVNKCFQVSITGIEDCTLLALWGQCYVAKKHGSSGVGLITEVQNLSEDT